MISRLDGQSMFALFTGRHVEGVKRVPTWRLHTRLCNFVLNISTNISALGQSTTLNFGTVFFIYRLQYHNFLTLSVA